MSRFNTPGRSTTHRERYFHLPVEGGLYSHITVYARETSIDSGVWQLGYAFCSVNDAFCKKIGRSLSRRRLMVTRQQSYTPDDSADIPTVRPMGTSLYDAIAAYLVDQGYIEESEEADDTELTTAETVLSFVQRILR